MSKYILVKYSADYADEFDCEGFGIFEKTEWEEIKKETEKSFEEDGSKERCFGTNEYLQFEDYDDWLRSFKEYDISEEEAETFKRLFGKRPFGTGSGIFYLG